MTPAQRMLVLASRSRQSPSQLDEMRGFPRDEVFWDEVIEASLLHRTLPLVAETVLRAGLEIPSPVAAELRGEAEENRRRNLFLMGTLASLCRGMTEAGLELVPYKGPLLALQAYGDLGRRMFHDLDLLVPEGQAQRTLDWLSGQGYRVDSRDDYHSRLSKGPLPVVLEVHWGFVEGHFGFPLRWGDIRERLAPVSVGGATIHTLSAEDRFLVLAFHGAKHMWNRLAWICDLSEWMARTPDMDWPGLRERAKRLGVDRVCRLGLELAHTLLDSELPEVWSYPDPRVESLRGSCLEELFRRRTGPTDPRRLYFFHWRMRERKRDRLRYAWGRILPTQEDQGRFRLPRWLRALYLALRPLRIAAKFLRRPSRG